VKENAINWGGVVTSDDCLEEKMLLAFVKLLSIGPSLERIKRN